MSGFFTSMRYELKLGYREICIYLQGSKYIDGTLYTEWVNGKMYQDPCMGGHPSALRGSMMPLGFAPVFGDGSHRSRSAIEDPGAAGPPLIH